MILAQVLISFTTVLIQEFPIILDSKEKAVSQKCSCSHCKTRRGEKKAWNPL